MRRGRDCNTLLRTVFRSIVDVTRGCALLLTSPRLRGEVGLRSNPGEGVQVHQRAAAFAERAPHPNPLPAKSGERESQHRQAARFRPAGKSLVERGDVGGPQV